MKNIFKVIIQNYLIVIFLNCSTQQEKLKTLKFQDEISPSETTEDSDPQERNLIKSKLNSQAKTVHKDMIRNSSAKKPVLPVLKHTAGGTYMGVPTDTDDTSDTDDLTSTSESQNASVIDLRAKIDSLKSPDPPMSTFGKSMEKISNLKKSEPQYANEPTDPMMLVLADVHSKREKPAVPKKPANLYVKASELKPVMSTFGGEKLNPVNASTPVRDSDANDFNDFNDLNNLNSAEDILDSFSKKLKMDGPWFTQTFGDMGDITEESQDEQQSVRTNSVSMYGSSEIFDAGDKNNSYYNLDSDIDVPPLDSEDVLSDGGLPSPLGFPLNRPGVKGKVNDDIKLIPGALKSPGPNIPFLVKPRPNSSIILKSDRTKDSAVISTTASPPLPLPPSNQGNQSDSVFEFPPPPNTANGDYVELNNPADSAKPGDSRSGKKRNGRAGAPLAPT